MGSTVKKAGVSNIIIVFLWVSLHVLIFNNIIIMILHTKISTKRPYQHLKIKSQAEKCLMQTIKIKI